MSNNLPHIVYHYCSLETFKKIIENKTIRLSNIYKLNDDSEINYCYALLESALKKALEEFTSEYIKDKEIKKYFKNINLSDLSAKSTLNESLFYYVACFSSESDLLSQWRGYGNNGKGVSIGFYSENFINAQDYTNLRYDKMEYDVTNIEDKLYNMILNDLSHTNSKANIKKTFSAYETSLKHTMTNIIYDSVFFKNPAFREENEWRLVFYPFGNIENLLINHKSRDISRNQLFYDRMTELIEYEKKYQGFVRKKLKFDSKGNSLYSYIDMGFENISNQFISEIIIGPRCNIDDKDLRLFLIANGYDLTKINIKKSTAPYRQNE